MTKSERLRRRIVWWLRHEWQWTEGGNSWQGFKALAEDLRANPVAIKREVRRLARAGVLNLSFMVNGDGQVAGRGYFLAGDWERHRTGRPEDPAPEDYENAAAELTRATSEVAP